MLDNHVTCHHTRALPEIVPYHHFPVLLLLKTRVVFLLETLYYLLEFLTVGAVVPLTRVLSVSATDLSKVTMTSFLLGKARIFVLNVSLNNANALTYP